MQLIIKNKVIDAPIYEILQQVHRETNGKYLNTIIDKGDNVFIQCPFHSDGKEKHPSCTVFARDDDKLTMKGTTHCFACGISVPLYTLVGHCFGEDDEYGKEWLVQRYANIFIQKETILPEIQLKPAKEPVLDESILNQFAYFHPYQFQRKLTEETILKYRVGYDKESDSITFPVWDEHNRLRFITKRSVKGKQFFIPPGVKKPVYLLNFMLKENRDTVFVAESQINALYLNSLGYPAVALIGTGTKEQYEILNRCPIRHYILAFDGDAAGDKAITRFLTNIRKDVFVDIMLLPRGKDCNDLTGEEIAQLPLISQYVVS